MITKAEVNEQIQVLNEMQILKKKGHKHDIREKRVRKILMTAQTDIQLENMLRDLKHGNIMLNNWLERKERELNALQTAAG